jgi:hypothetical protein
VDVKGMSRMDTDIAQGTICTCRRSRGTLISVVLKHLSRQVVECSRLACPRSKPLDESGAAR